MRTPVGATLTVTPSWWHCPRRIEEAKCADASGAPCRKQTAGLLQRRHVAIGALHLIGKESNKLEEVEEGSVTDAGDVYTEYPDPRRNAAEWDAAAARLGAMSKGQLREVSKASGISLTTLRACRRGRTPHLRNRLRLLAALAGLVRVGDATA
jgi:hypothetical protein